MSGFWGYGLVVATTTTADATCHDVEPIISKIIWFASQPRSPLCLVVLARRGPKTSEDPKDPKAFHGSRLDSRPNPFVPSFSPTSSAISRLLLLVVLDTLSSYSFFLCDIMDRAQPGHTVKFQGLQSAVHLNGTRGTLIEYHRKGSCAGRWAVRCANAGREVVTAKPQNLKLIAIKQQQQSSSSKNKDPDEPLKGYNSKYAESLKQGHEWHTQDKEESAIELKDWVNTAFAIGVDFDEKIKHYHGFVQWVNGDRNDSGFLNIRFRHVCDALVMLRDKPGTSSFVTNMEDNLTDDQIAFVRDNFDFLWIGYHDIDSKFPIIAMPGTERTNGLFQDETFQKKQAEKLKKLNTFNEWMFWNAHQKGIYKHEGGGTYKTDGSPVMHVKGGEVFQFFPGAK